MTGSGSPPTSPAGAGNGRVSGDPPSANGASSFHLFWDLAGEFVVVRATLEVAVPPAVGRLYFWALQVDFTDGGGHRGGGAHLGLQWHPSYPGSTAVNWGGYGPAGGVLDGTESPLAGTLGNPHTRDFAWEANRAYRLAIEPAPPEEQPGRGRTAWRGSVTDVLTGETTVVRDLLPAGSRLTRPMVWSEVFAACDHPSVEVRWSELQAFDDSWQLRRPRAVSTNYQRYGDGGCANTESTVEGGVAVQRTNVARVAGSGTRSGPPELTNRGGGLTRLDVNDRPSTQPVRLATPIDRRLQRALAEHP